MRRKGYIRVGWRIVSKSLSKRIPKMLSQMVIRRAIRIIQGDRREGKLENHLKI